MRVFANIFLKLFLLDGIVSLTDELIRLFFSVSLLSFFRDPLALLVTVLAVPLFIGLGINRHLPKRIFFPQIIFILWCFAGLWPLPAVVGYQATAILAAISQILLAYLPYATVRRRLRRGLKLHRDLFPRPTFNRRYSLKFGVASLLLAPFVLLLTSWLSVCYFVDLQSGGFVRLNSDGLYMVERTYVSNDKTIRLTSMIHIGDRAFYDEMAQANVSGRTIMLAEGVSDRDGLLVHAFNYTGLADLLGLSTQDQMPLNGRLLSAEQLTAPDFVPDGRDYPDIIVADLDIRDFDILTINFFNTLGRHLREAESFAAGFKTFLLWSNAHVTAEMNETITADIIGKRNLAVIGYLAKSLDRYDTVLIPWGAMHMPGIEQAVIKQGFRLKSSRERRSIDFSALPVQEFLSAFQ